MKRKNSFNQLGVLLVVLITGFNIQHLNAQEHQEVVITIDSVASSAKLSAFENGEILRKNNKFRAAIAEYEKVIVPG